MFGDYVLFLRMTVVFLNQQTKDQKRIGFLIFIDMNPNDNNNNSQTTK